MNTAPSGVTTTDGVQIAVHDLGGGGPNLLMAHATGFHGLVLAPLAAELAGSFRSISFDERGHGDSGLPPGMDFGWRGFAADALAVASALGLEKPFAFGHSGGGAGLLLAELAAPGTFSAIYCFEPIVIPTESEGASPPNPANPLSVGALRRRESFPSKQAAYEHYSAREPLSVLAPDVLRAYVDHGFKDLPSGGVRLKCRGANEAAVYANAIAHDAYHRLADIRCPVVVACGAESDSITPAHARHLADRLPSSTLEVLPGLGHFAPLQDPRAVARSLLRTLLWAK